MTNENLIDVGDCAYVYSNSDLKDGCYKTLVSKIFFDLISKTFVIFLPDEVCDWLINKTDFENDLAIREATYKGAQDCFIEKCKEYAADTKRTSEWSILIRTYTYRIDGIKNNNISEYRAEKRIGIVEGKNLKNIEQTAIIDEIKPGDIVIPYTIQGSRDVDKFLSEFDKSAFGLIKKFRQDVISCFIKNGPANNGASY